MRGRIHVLGSFHSIDATEENDSLCRLVNDGDGVHEPINAQIQMVSLGDRRQPQLCLFATRDIFPGMELRYDYGEYTLPWRKVNYDPVITLHHLMNTS